jgi:DNA polymerase III subunit epsilon
MLNRPMVFLDLETTGGAAHRDRIIEIGLIESDGKGTAGEWSTLVNPQLPVPSGVQTLTGITDAMLATAPSFDELAPELYRRLEGKILVAHNARFDYGFLRSEFRRVGYRYAPDVLCTVRLSRRLYPHEEHHNLDSLIERHRLICNARHRALGDARVLWDFAHRLGERFDSHTLASAVNELLRPPAWPAALAVDAVEALPDSPGVYVLYDEAGHALYIGRAGNLYSRVLTHFNREHRSGRDGELAARVRRLDWQATTGEFGAAVRQTRLIGELQPAHNRAAYAELPVGFRWNAMDGPQVPALVEVGSLDGAGADDLFGVFRSRAVANSALRGLADAHALCRRLIGLEPDAGACSAYMLKRCRGACVGKEPARTHHARLAAALAPLRVQRWPFAGKIGVRERDPCSGEAEVHVFDRWCYIATTQSEADLSAAAETRPAYGFELDTYKLLRRTFRQPPRNIEIFDLE